MLSPGTRKNIKSAIVISLAGALIGALFANLVYGFTLYRVVKGMTTGFLITSISSAFELFYFQKKLKRLSFPAVLSIKTFFYILVISFSTILVVLIHESMESNEDLISTFATAGMKEFFRDDFVTILIFAVVSGFSINFMWQLNRMLGKGVLINLVLGKYVHPKSEKRIFLFLDLKSSTTLAEQLETFNYSSLIQDFFSDVTDPIIQTRGDIYQYIGDEIVLTWKENKGIRNNNCVECFFKIKEKIAEKEKYYFEKYGVVPAFKAGVHCGESVVTEVGEIKKEIVYHGDVLNTTARIQEQCNILNKEFLISDDLMNKLNLNREYKTEKMGTFKLRGKEKEIDLLSIERM